MFRPSILRSVKQGRGEIPYSIFHISHILYLIYTKKLYISKSGLQENIFWLPRFFSTSYQHSTQAPYPNSPSTQYSNSTTTLYSNPSQQPPPYSHRHQLIQSNSNKTILSSNKNPIVSPN